jgi:Ca2+-binding RTX toxin-like protein
MGFVGEGQRLFSGSGMDTVDVTLALGDNRIDLGSDADTFFGGTNDRVLAGDGDDIIFFGSGGGNNVVTGGSGSDQFWLVTDTAALPTVANTITDFTMTEDVIGFANTDLSFADLTLTQTQVNNQVQTTINALGQDLAVLLNVTSADLTTTDFVFA